MTIQDIRFSGYLENLKTKNKINKLERELEAYKQISFYVIDNGIRNSEDVGEKDLVDEFDREVIDKLWGLGVGNE